MLNSLFSTLPAHLQRPAKWASIAALLIGMYAAAGFWWAPRLITHHASDYVRSELHRELQLGSVQFNPFTLTLRAGPVSLKDSQTQLLSLNALLVNVEADSLLTRTLHFKAIDLDAPAVNGVVDAQGRFNLDFSDPAKPKANSNAPLPAIRIDEFRLRGGQVHLQDLSGATPLNVALRPIEFTLQDFRTLPGHENGFHFHGMSLAKEVFDWQGNFTLQPFGSSGRVSINNLQASTLQQYAADALPVHLLGGVLHASASYQMTFADTLALQLNASRIGIDNLQVAPKSDASTAWLNARAIEVNNVALSLTQRSAHIAAINIDDAKLNAWFDADYKLNLLDLLPPADPDAPAWHTRIDSIALRNADIPLQDRTVTPAAMWHLAPANVVLNNFNSAPGSTLDLNIKLRINDGGELAATGKTELDTQRTELQLALQQFALRDLQSYAQANTDLRINSGTLSTTGKLQYRGSAKQQAAYLSYTGNARIADLNTQDTVDNKDFIAWQALELNKLRYSIQPDQLDIAEIVARKPFGRFIMAADGSTNIQHVLRMQPAANSQDTAQASTVTTAHQPTAKQTGMTLRINRVRIEEGALDFTDHSVQPNFATGMGMLNGTLTGLSSQNGSRAKLALQGLVDRYAPVDISGELNFLAADVYSDVSLNFRNMELTTFNPYSGKFAGYSIAKGKLATELRYKVSNRKLDAQHHIVLDQLEFGDATDSKDAVPLPVKFAVALLKDRNGVIDLELPVSGSLDDPQFRVGPIVWKLFKGFLSKVVTAPFAALGRLFGGGEELEYVDFTPGSAVLAATETDKLSKLAHGMAERPQLKMDIPLGTVSDADLTALRDAAFNAALPANTTPQQQLKALTTLYQRQLGKAAEFPESASKDPTTERIAFLTQAIKNSISIDAAQRDALARARANAVHDALATQPDIAAERIFMTQRSSELKAPDGVVRMQLKLQ